MTHTSTEQPSLAAIIHDLRESHARTSPGAWGKGATTHETVSRAEGREPYKVAEFRHANDAQFCDLAHVFVPRLLSEIEALQSRIQELEAEATHNAKQASLTDSQITQTLWNEHLRGLRERGVDTEGMQPCGNWLAGWIPYARAIERAHGIKQEKQGMTYYEIRFAWNAQADDGNRWHSLSVPEKIEWAAIHAAAKEREACAKACEGMKANRDWAPGSLWGNIRSEMAAAIRARQ